MIRQSIVRDWREKQASVRPSVDPAALRRSTSHLEAMAALQGDPFQGAKERRIDGMTAVEMATNAARDALEGLGCRSIRY